MADTGWFSGWDNTLVAGEDFTFPVHTVLVLDEEEVEDPLEPGIPVIVEEQAHPAVYMGGAMPYQTMTQGWSSLAIALQTLCMILGGKADAWQENHYVDRVMQQPTFHFKFEPGAKGFQKGRL